MSGKYKAFVVANDYSSLDCPYKGCIKVVCPDLFGYKVAPANALSEVFLSNCNESDWIEPHYTHPGDCYIPMLGEGVFIECLAGADIDNMIWTGVYLFEEDTFINMKTKSVEFDFNPNFSEKTDRIIGTRNGSYIKIEDKSNGKFVIEICAKDALHPIRTGHKLTIDPLGGFSYEDKDGTSKIELDSSGCLIQDIFGNKIESVSGKIKINDTALEVSQ
jgi:hypothetical protein